MIRAIPLVESLPAVYQMEEMLHALGPYAAGLNAARWDLKASIFEFVMADPKSVWPDRFGVDIKTTPFLANIFRRLVAVCLKRGAVPIGGMATALPSHDPEVNRVAARVHPRRQGVGGGAGVHPRLGRPHLPHEDRGRSVPEAASRSGWKPTARDARSRQLPGPDRGAGGADHLEGTRRNARMVVEYVEGWLNGRGAKGIDSLAGKPGVHPALMEDLATGRMSVAQIAQRIRHRARDHRGPRRGPRLSPSSRRLLEEECDDILAAKRDRRRAAHAEAEARYRKAVKIAMHWIKSYTDLDFRSLGSYTRADLDGSPPPPTRSRCGSGTDEPIVSKTHRF